MPFAEGEEADWFKVSGFKGNQAAASGSKQAVVAEEKKAVVEKTVFNVKMVAVDSAKKINVIKEVKNLLGLGLKESKEFVESLPNLIKKDVKKEEAEILAKKFTDVGATVELE